MEEFTKADIYNFWRYGQCPCGARKFERQAFCAECYAEVSPATKKHLKAEIGRSGKRQVLKPGFNDVYKKAWRERNGESVGEFEDYE